MKVNLIAWFYVFYCCGLFCLIQPERFKIVLKTKPVVPQLFIFTPIQLLSGMRGGFCFILIKMTIYKCVMVSSCPAKLVFTPSDGGIRLIYDHLVAVLIPLSLRFKTLLFFKNIFDIDIFKKSFKSQLSAYFYSPHRIN